jgi:hypothetical protein
MGRIERPIFWSQARRLTTGLHPVAPRSRQWTTGDLNPAPPACDAGALPDELAAQGRRGDAAAAVPAGMAGLPVMLTLWRSQNAITFPPEGVVIRRDGEIRTPGAQFWRLLFSR